MSIYECRIISNFTWNSNEIRVGEQRYHFQFIKRKWTWRLSQDTIITKHGSLTAEGQFFLSDDRHCALQQTASNALYRAGPFELNSIYIWGAHITASSIPLSTTSAVNNQHTAKFSSCILHCNSLASFITLHYLNPHVQMLHSDLVDRCALQSATNCKHAGNIIP